MNQPLKNLMARLRGVLPGANLTHDDAGLAMGQRRIIWTIAGAVGALFIWGAFFNLDIASQGVGEVVPSGQVKRIQHLEGGIVREIYVHEGDKVKAGQALVELEGTASGSETAEVASRIGALQIKVTRLYAQLRRDKQVNFDSELEQRFPDQVAAARQMFYSQRERIVTNNSGQTFKVSQRRAEIDEIRSRITQMENRSRLLAEQLAISEKLLQEGLTNKYTHLELLKEQANVTGQIDEAQASIRRAGASLSQEQVAMTGIDATANEDLRKDLEESRTQLGELQERFKKFADSDRRTMIRAPIDGVVMSLFVVTRGGVVPAGGTVLTLVPGNDRLVIEAKLPVSDVGFVQVGQHARLQLMASAGRRLQPMTGRVIHVSPDVITEPQKEPYVLVRIAPDSDRFANHAFSYRLTPGAQLRASIVTGERSVLGYLFDPFLTGMHGAMSET